MHTVGIVCEYNPMHLGHLYQINEIKKLYPDSIIAIVCCSCFTQRGELCVMNKWEKCRIALENGVDLVIELPFVYATQGADIFASGSIKLLDSIGIDTLVFGSESNDIKKLESIAYTQLNDNNYDDKVRIYLDKGVNYPTAMSLALKDILGYSVSSPNDLLAISYIKEIIKNNYRINYISIKRTNSYYGDDNINDNIASASYIRDMYKKGEDIVKYLVKDSYSYLYKDISMDRVFPYLKYRIISDRLDDIVDVDEGIHNKLKKNIMRCNCFNDIIDTVKSKRYTYNKINRMLVHILCNFTKVENKDKNIDYVRLLGFSPKGQKYLGSIRKDKNIPIITHYKRGISNIFDIEYRITCIYGMIMGDENLAKDEYSHKPIRVD